MTSGCINRPVPCSQLVWNMWNTLLCYVTVNANYFYQVPQINEPHVSGFGLWAQRNMSNMKRHCRRRVISQLLWFQTLNIRHEYRTVLYIAKSVFKLWAVCPVFLVIWWICYQVTSLRDESLCRATVCSSIWLLNNMNNGDPKKSSNCLITKQTNSWTADLTSVYCLYYVTWTLQLNVWLFVIRKLLSL